jgi:DNA adenine methylase
MPRTSPVSREPREALSVTYETGAATARGQESPVDEVALDGLAPASLVEAPKRPFLKWAGGKTRLLPKLLPYVPASICDYHEPFLGGGAMFFAVYERVAGMSHLADLNEELINTWLVVRDHAPQLRRMLDNYKERDSKEFFYSQRPRQPQDHIDRASRFLYLNQTSWNGLWRVNRWGEYNVPWGQRPFRGFTTSQLTGYRSLLRAAKIDVLDFREALERPKAGDFVYLDPPYLPLSETSKFFLYTEKRFRAPDLCQLAQCCEELSSRGVRWILSNRDTPLVRELFDHAQIVGLTAKRSVAAQNRRDVEDPDSPEVVVIGGPE